MLKVIQTMGAWGLALLFLLCSLIYEKDMTILSLLGIILFTGLIILFVSTIYKFFVSPVMYKGLLVFSLTFLSRMFYVTYMRNHIAQVSDFDTTLHYAQTGIYAEKVIYYSHFPHKLAYPFFLHSAGLNTQNRILMFQIVCVSFIALFIYSIGKMMFSEHIGLYASFLYILWPAHIVYTSVITEEHLGGIDHFNLLLAYFIFKKENTPPPKKYFLHSQNIPCK